MTIIDEARVEAHYTRQNLLSTIRDGLTAAGFDPDSPDASALSAVDEFHIGGSEASRFVGEALGAASGLRVLDIGCGNGALLDYLGRNKGVDGRGIELSQAGVNACVANGLSVIQGDADTDLEHYPDDAFDYVVLTRTLQATRNRSARTCVATA